jgi:methylenetetrahydrofolate reductase (NADPH)
LPAPLLEELEKNAQDKAAVVQTGIKHATAQCRELIKRGVAGIHFYTLNKSHATAEIVKNLKAEGLV